MGDVGSGKDDLVVRIANLLDALYQNILEVTGAVLFHTLVLHVVGEDEPGIFHRVVLE